MQDKCPDFTESSQITDYLDEYCSGESAFGWLAGKKGTELECARGLTMSRFVGGASESGGAQKSGGTYASGIGGYYPVETGSPIPAKEKNRRRLTGF